MCVPGAAIVFTDTPFSLTALTTFVGEAALGELCSLLCEHTETQDARQPAWQKKQLFLIGTGLPCRFFWC